MHLCFRMPSAYLTTLLLNNDTKVDCDYTNLLPRYIRDRRDPTSLRVIFKGTCWVPLGGYPSSCSPKYYPMLPYTTIIYVIHMLVV